MAEPPPWHRARVHKAARRGLQSPLSYRLLLLFSFPGFHSFLSPVTHILRLTLNWACEVSFYIIGLFKELALREFPGGPVVRTLVLPLLRAQVLSLVGELRSQMPHSVGKK